MEWEVTSRLVRVKAVFIDLGNQLRHFNPRTSKEKRTNLQTSAFCSEDTRWLPVFFIFIFASSWIFTRLFFLPRSKFYYLTYSLILLLFAGFHSYHHLLQGPFRAGFLFSTKRFFIPIHCGISPPSFKKLIYLAVSYFLLVSHLAVPKKVGMKIVSWWVGRTMVVS